VGEGVNQNRKTQKQDRSRDQDQKKGGVVTPTFLSNTVHTSQLRMRSKKGRIGTSAREGEVSTNPMTQGKKGVMTQKSKEIRPSLRFTVSARCHAFSTFWLPWSRDMTRRRSRAAWAIVIAPSGKGGGGVITIAPTCPGLECVGRG
jgi:hypothetical protein